MFALKAFSAFLCMVLVTSNSVNLVSEPNKLSLTVKFDNTKDSNIGWWQTAAFYQIYVRSFLDSDGDGNGDIRGIIQKLDHFTDAGVDAIWLTPIYVSPQVDGGYDVADYVAIDPTYGDITDFVDLIETAHNRSLKVILDFVPNHSSDQHVWFNKSVNRVAGYEDYYVWHTGKLNDDGSRSPPNNWLSVFGGSAWEWSDFRQQYYLHQFTKQQPDLNVTNPKVIQEFRDILTYWLDLGVDGFRVDAVSHLVEDSQFRDEPILNNTGLDSSKDYNALDHIYTKDQNTTFEIVYGLREFLDNYTAYHDGNERIFMTEATSDDLYTVSRYYGNEDGSLLGAHFSFNFWLLGVDSTTTPEDLILITMNWYQLNYEYTKNWLLGNHDNTRVATRVGDRNVDGYNMLISFLSGAMITYMGEEIGQRNGNVTCEQGKDPSAIGDCSTFQQKSRDFERTPYQWDNTTNAGFTSGNTTWLPVGDNKVINLADEKAQNRSHYKVYQSITNLRKSYGVDQTFEIGYLGNLKDNVVYVTREFQDSPTNTAPYYLLVFNIGNNTVEYGNDVENVEVVASSMNSLYTIDDIILKGENVTIAPGDSLIVRPTNITQLF